MNSRFIVAEPPSAPAPAPFASFSRYDSGWVRVNNRVSHNLEFEHSLGIVPTQLTLFFSPDRHLVFPLPAAWNTGNTSNPVSVWVTPRLLTMSIAAGYPLHGLWDARTAAWSHWEVGYFRVFLNP